MQLVINIRSQYAINLVKNIQMRENDGLDAKFEKYRRRAKLGCGDVTGFVEYKPHKSSATNISHKECRDDY